MRARSLALALTPLALGLAVVVAQRCWTPTPTVELVDALVREGAGGPAVAELAARGPRVVPALLQGDVDPALAAAVCEEVGPTAVEALDGLLRDGAPEQVVGALRVLGHLETLAAPALPSVAWALYHPEPMVRAMAARASGRHGKRAVTAVPGLIKALTAPEWEVRLCAAEALGSISDDPAVIEALGAALDDEVYLVEQAARDSLRAIRGRLPRDA